MLALAASWLLPQRFCLHRGAKFFVGLGRPVEHFEKLLIAFAVYLDDGLIEDGVFRGSPSRLDNEVGTGATEHHRGMVNQGARLGAHPQSLDSGGGAWLGM